MLPALRQGARHRDAASIEFGRERTRSRARRHFAAWPGVRRTASRRDYSAIRPGREELEGARLEHLDREPHEESWAFAPVSQPGPVKIEATRCDRPRALVVGVAPQVLFGWRAPRAGRARREGAQGVRVAPWSRGPRMAVIPGTALSPVDAASAFASAAAQRASGGRAAGASRTPLVARDVGARARGCQGASPRLGPVSPPPLPQPC